MYRPRIPGGMVSWASNVPIYTRDLREGSLEIQTNRWDPIRGPILQMWKKSLWESLITQLVSGRIFLPGQVRLQSACHSLFQARARPVLAIEHVHTSQGTQSPWGSLSPPLGPWESGGWGGGAS